MNEVRTLLTRREAAKYLRRSKATLDRWAWLGIGPQITRGLYDLADLNAWLDGASEKASA
jgi:hypothetical protein